MNGVFPLRAAFYYPWYPETWGPSDPQTHFEPVLGYYDTEQVLAKHAAELVYARVNLGIASWWGPGTHREDVILPQLLEVSKGTRLGWTVYYEKGEADAATIASDLLYLHRYTSNPRWMHIDNKPVIFIYNTSGGCDVIDRWHSVAPDWYFVPKIFNGWRDCANQPPSWHQYGPDTPIQTHLPFSSAISPGFWKWDESNPRLERNVSRFFEDVDQQAQSGANWQLITTFNEWGEGTAIEPATEWGQKYLDILHARRFRG